MLKSKLRSSNPFGNANVKNEDRRQIWNDDVTNAERRQISGKSRQQLRVLTAKTPRLLDGSSPNSERM